MPKPRKRRPPPVAASPAATAAGAGQAKRLASLDALRGLAIVLMLIDHFAWLFGDPQIAPGHVRFLTRLSMPLFCVVSGYLLAARIDRRPALNWKRLSQVALAAVIVNAVYYWLYEQVEILASLLVCYLLFGGLRTWSVWLLPLCWLFPLDFTQAAFDYPVSVVMTCLAGGIVLRHWGSRPAVVGTLSVVLPVAVAANLPRVPVWIPPPTVYVLYGLPLAVGLLAAGVRWPGISWSPCSWLGARPLQVYVTQYLGLLAAHQAWQQIQSM